MKSLGLIVLAGVVMPLAMLAASNAEAANTITFDNQSGKPALVKLVGPTPATVAVPEGTKQTTNAAAGHYTIKVRYGTPGAYAYSQGDEFDVKETATSESAITITLHAVVNGNYGTHSISEVEFGTDEQHKLSDIPNAEARPSTSSYNNQGATFGPWHLKVESFSTTQTLVRQQGLTKAIEIRSSDPQKEVAIVTILCKPIRQYTDDEKKILQQSSIGKAGLQMSALSGGDALLSNPCFWLGYALDKDGKQQLSILSCDSSNVEKGGIPGFVIESAQSNSRIFIDYARLGDNEMTERLVFANWPKGKVPILFFQPLLGNDIYMARITLTDAGTLSGVEYGDLETLKKYIPDVSPEFNLK